jgi:hypothetical protein
VERKGSGMGIRLMTLFYDGIQTIVMYEVLMVWR